MTVFRFHDRDDRGRASDGLSRYGAYLRQNADRFSDWDGQVTSGPGQFARAAWEVATSPVMAPPYLDWTAERLLSVELAGSQWDGSLIARLQVTLPRPAELRGVRGLADWRRGESWRESRGYRAPEDDEVAARPALLASALLVCPVPDEVLYVPRDAPGAVSVRDAKRAVKRLAEVLTEQVTPVLAALDPAPIGAGW